MSIRPKSLGSSKTLGSRPPDSLELRVELETAWSATITDEEAISLKTRNVRKDGRGLVEVDSIQADNVKRICHLFAYENHTLNTLVEQLANEGRFFRSSMHRFPRSSVHNILSDRAYIGEIEFHGQWYPVRHEPLIDRATWDRAQALLGPRLPVACADLFRRRDPVRALRSSDHGRTEDENDKSR
jgi:hypothetical protein